MPPLGPANAPMPLGPIPPGPPMTKPMLPGNPMGGPTGPGKTPMTAPGGGAGREMKADADVAAVLPVLHASLNSYPPDSKKYKGLLNALRALTANFGKPDAQNLTPAAATQIGMAAKQGGPTPPTPPPAGVQGGPFPQPVMSEQETSPSIM